jgi:hypothetical protein
MIAVRGTNAQFSYTFVRLITIMAGNSARGRQVDGAPDTPPSLRHGSLEFSTFIEILWITLGAHSPK